MNVTDVTYVCDRLCPCGGELTRKEEWDPWECKECARHYTVCEVCWGFVQQYAYEHERSHGIEKCVASLGARLADLERDRDQKVKP